MNQMRLKQLISLLSLPTAPFRESHIQHFVTATLTEAKIPFLEDPVGNIVVGTGSRAEYRALLRRRTQEPLRLFIAHMDHPGFHGVAWRTPGRRLKVQWYGGSPVRGINGTRVWLADVQGYVATGRFDKVRIGKHRHAIETAEVALDKPLPAKVDPRTLFGAFQFKQHCWRQGQRLYTKAADDLVGVFTILELARRTRGRRAPFLGLLTRAEEVGFIGAIGHFELGWLADARRPLLCVSLETSRALPGAIIGQGPVVRLGDRRTVFDAAGLKVLSDLARQVLPQAHQKRVMDGGTCEATAATVYGLPAIGLSVPLGNYHNQLLGDAVRAAKLNTPAPEYVAIDDIDGMITLCEALLRARLPWGDSWQDLRQRFRKILKRYRPLL
jgi:endoglucanase